MTHLKETEQKYVPAPLPAIAHIGVFSAEKLSATNSAIFPFPERVNKKIARIYELMEAKKLTAPERKELKLLLAEDRVMAYHISTQLLTAENWKDLAANPGMKVLLTRTPIQVISSLTATLEVALLIESPPVGTFDMAKSLSNVDALPESLLTAVVGHPLLPQRLRGEFQELFETFVSELTV